jgi:hypothetical protein
MGSKNPPAKLFGPFQYEARGTFLASAEGGKFTRIYVLPEQPEKDDMKSSFPGPPEQIN